MKYFISIFLVLLFSCNPLRHYQAVATDTEVTPKEKATLSGWVAVNYPPAPPVYIKGKDSVVTVTTEDSSKINTLLSQLEVYKDLDSLSKDSLKREFLKLCKTTTTTVYKTRVDTVEKSSSADQATITSLQRQLSTATATDAAKDVKISTLEDTNKAQGKRNLYLIIGVIVLGIATLFLGYLLIKPKAL